MAFSFVQIKEYGPGATFTATAAANHVGGNTTYTGTFSNDNAGHPVTITGFTNGNNNGSFTVVSNTSTTMTMNNPNGVAETHAGSLAFGSPSLNSIFTQITPTVGNFLIVVIWVGNSSAQTVSSVVDGSLIFSISSVATSSGGSAVYTGTITGGAANAFAGFTFVIVGFAGANNNGTFACTASTATTLTLSNGSATAQSNSATALSTNNIYANTNLHVNGGVNSGTSVDMWYAPVTVGGTLNVSPTWNSGGGYSHMVVVEYSGVTSFDFGSVVNGNPNPSIITNASSTSNELEIWTLLDHGFTTIIWDQPTITSRTSANNGGPVGNSAFSYAEQPNPHYYTTGSTSITGSPQIIMQSAVFKTNTSVSGALTPYVGYGALDCGGIALPAQKASSTIFNTNQLSFLPAPITGGGRGPTNNGVAYQGTGGGATTGFGQIYPTGRNPIG